jgi:nucleoid-associated protein YgaU
MTNDAKLGLVVGVCLVIGTAVVFFRRDLVPERSDGVEAMATSAGAPRAQYARTFTPPPPTAPVRAMPVHKGQNHTVKHGESLYSLAQQYYGDGKKYTEIYKVNRRLVNNPDYVAPGTVLFIPDLPGKDALAIPNEQ